ncbi:MAG: hypothetical protein R2939_22485, partial [Kofleriaceae bacterium]
MKVYVDGAPVAVLAKHRLAQGGEADVFDLGDGRVLKLWKPPTHPDLVGDPLAQAAAAARLDEHQHKLRELPPGLPAQVVTPTALAVAGRRGGRVVGFVMPRVRGEHLLAWGEPRWRREHGQGAAAGVAVLRSLRATLAAVHAAGVVVGDLNDLNVLVDGARPQLIDVDSWQFGRWRSMTWTERYVDPRLCDEVDGAPRLARPHDQASDHFALAAMTCRVLLGVGPYGGVHQPASAAARVSPAERPARGLSVFEPDVIYPRAATPWRALPAPLVSWLRETFAGGRRELVPEALLDLLVFTTCRGCGLEHVHARCPRCAHVVPVAVTTRGALRVTPVDPRAVPTTTWAVGAVATPGAPPVVLRGGVLARATALGEVAIGDVVGAEARVWTSARQGVGFYRVGALTVGLWFDPHRGGLADGLRLPPAVGELVSASAVIGDARAWLGWRCAHCG